MNTLQQRLEAGHVLVADGATGTNLQTRSVRNSVHMEDLVIDHPEWILALETAFMDAGADIILTCTFGATATRMEGSPYSERSPEINARAATLARKAASSRPVLIGGSMGPLGKLLAPYGPLSREAATLDFTEQARALADGGVDFLVVETQYSLQEAEAAMEAVSLSAPALPTVLSFSYDRGTRTMMGVTPTEAAHAASQLGATMLGINCGTSLENALAVLRESSASGVDLPIWMKPNAGLPRMVEDRAVYDVTPQAMAEFSRRAIGWGARVVGGCCGSTPEHINAIANEVRISHRQAPADGGDGNRGPRG